MCLDAKYRVLGTQSSSNWNIFVKCTFNSDVLLTICWYFSLMPGLVSSKSFQFDLSQMYLSIAHFPLSDFAVYHSNMELSSTHRSAGRNSSYDV